ncbi:dienelactone hydrolase family protein [Synechococcus sp. CCY 9618]|uniref:dienelactone hydrolase family protein n=1 Tax=Synechococcus sp. CCY 9618 TaxID=2815602 RepID=UPI0020B1FDB9|nr:dienelactone hydrolase family protein [Synechococcus sp. CCY 9618]
MPSTDPPGPGDPTNALPPEGVRADWLRLDPRRPEQVPLRCWWARPAHGSPRGGVLVLPEVFGINRWVRGVAERLAAEGYGALAVPLYGRTAPELELGYGPEDLALGRRHKERTRTDQLLSDGALAADWLQGQLVPTGTGAPPPGLGCVGFCFGGHVALLAATLPQVKASVAFYGAGVASGRPGGGPPSLALVPAIAGSLLCICGSEDALIPPADVAAIEATLAAANAGRSAAPAGPAPHRLVVLEAGHGFMCAERPDHRPAAAAAGWELLLDHFLRERVNGRGPGPVGS